jgi:hypothetical protein
MLPCIFGSRSSHTEKTLFLVPDFKDKRTLLFRVRKTPNRFNQLFLEQIMVGTDF